jgi:membrane-bound lytic murein transglycosylase C
VLDVWDEAEITDKTNWVEYSDDLKTKKVVDYENNEIRISIADSDTPPTDAEIQKYVEDIISTTPNQARKKDPVLSAIGGGEASSDPASNTSLLMELSQSEALEPKAEPAPTPKPVEPKVEKVTPAKEAAKPPVVAEPEPTAVAKKSAPVEPKPMPKQLAAKPKKMESSRAQARAVEATAKAAASKPATASVVAAQLASQAVVAAAKPSKKGKVTTITVKLPSDATYNRARQYEKDVNKRAAENKLDPSLIYAIMHTESAFNPMARSGVPAFGLMQIVPGSAGKDVTQRWYGKAKLMKPKELYDSKTNIRAGSTYLNILYYSYLKGIKDPTSRKYCAIAAYNTGAGNVSEAFIGSKRIRNAFPVINSMTPDEVYNTLIKKLPYDETRHYLQRVSSREKVYKQRML